MKVDAAPFRVPRLGRCPCTPRASPRGLQRYPGCGCVTAPAALQAAWRRGLRPCRRASAASGAARVVPRVVGCCGRAGSLRGPGAAARLGPPAGAATDAWASRLRAVIPPALPSDPGAERSLRRNVFQGEAGTAPAAEFFHAQSPSPALNGPVTQAACAPSNHLFKDFGGSRSQHAVGRRQPSASLGRC